MLMSMALVALEVHWTLAAVVPSHSCVFSWRALLEASQACLELQSASHVVGFRRSLSPFPPSRTESLRAITRIFLFQVLWGKCGMLRLRLNGDSISTCCAVT